MIEAAIPSVFAADLVSEQSLRAAALAYQSGLRALMDFAPSNNTLILQ